MNSEKPEELPEIDPAAGEQVDHPDEINNEEAQRGLLMYRAIDDLDDDSNGMDQ